MISENTLAKVRDLPIQRILEPYVKFKREGGHTLKGLCPFIRKEHLPLRSTFRRTCITASAATGAVTASPLSWRRKT